MFSKVNLTRTTLILVVGVAGVGKTTISTEILKRIFAVYLDNNFIVDPFFPNTRNSKDYLNKRPFFYKSLYKITEENLRLKNSVLLDVPHIKQMLDLTWKQYILNLISQTECRLSIIYCKASEKEIYNRLKNRAAKRDLWKIKNWTDHIKREPLNIKIPFKHITIDTELSLDENTIKCINYLTRESDT